MHLALKSAMSRIPYTNKVGETLSSIADPAAAYSLRALGGGDPMVARVRRSSDDAEKDFTASDMDSGSIADWVNGKQDTTLPCDVASAAAAYSLRSVNSNYTGSIVRVRRSSDNAEQDFSDVSLIADWVNTDVTVYQSDFSSGTDGWSVVNGSVAGNIDSVGGQDNNLKWTAPAGSFSAVRIAKSNQLNVGSKYQFTFDIYIPSTNSAYNSVFLRQITNSTTFYPTQDQWVTVSDTGEAESTIAQISFGNGNDPNGDDVIYIRNLTITQLTADGHVTTWYDQSGNSDDATQSVAASQPKIVDGGVYLGELDFDGVDDQLDYPLAISNLNNASSFVIASFQNTADNQFVLTMSGGGNNRWYAPIIWNGSYRFGYGFTVDSINIGTPDTNKHLFTATAGATTFEGFFDGVSKGSQVSASNTVGDQSFIGAHTTSKAYPLDGSISEIIIYNSDQSANRFKIESNINNYYDLYTNANDGFVTTWYDQSGNSNDATQSTAASQPKIVDAGVYLGELDFDGVDDFLGGTDNGSLDTIRLGEFSCFGVAKLDSFNSYASLFNLSSNSSNGEGALGFQFFRDSPRFGPHNTFVAATGLANVNLTNVNNKSLFTLIRDNSGTNGSGSNVTVYVKDDLGISSSNSATQGWSSNSGTNYYIGSQNNVGEWNGKISEIIIYDFDQSANRAAIETNINNHYDIY